VTSQRLVSLFWSLSLGILAFGLDRGHKYFQIEVQGWRGGEVIQVNDFFDYVLVWNTGISYGLLSSVPVVVLGLIMVVAIIALGVWWWRANTLLLQAGLALAIGGALSNMLDRVIYGAVADFFHFHIGGNSFYIFNLADAAITLGVILLLLDMLGVGHDKTLSGDSVPPAS
jgi:signal peptidase II